MESAAVSFIFFLITAGLAFFPFAIALWGRGKENPNVFIICGALAFLFAVANLLMVGKKAAGKAVSRIWASLALTLAGWMIAYPFYAKKFCPVCFVAGGRHPVDKMIGLILLGAGVIVFLLGWWVTGRRVYLDLHKNDGAKEV